MPVRFANNEDTNVVKEIWQKCFKDEEPFLSWNFERNYKSEDTIVFEQDGNIVSTLQMASCDISLWGERVSANYISGVATLSEFRNRGIAGMLTRRAFEVGIERGQAVSLLVPFNYNFYEKFGYKMCYKTVKATIKKENAPKLATGHKLKLCQINDETIAILQGIYKEFCKNLNGYVIRTDENFRLILEDVIDIFSGSLIVNKSETGDYNAYAICHFENGKLSIYEMAYTDYNGYKAIMSGIWDMFNECVEAEINCPLSRCGELLTTGGYNDGSKIFPFAMARVLYVEKILNVLHRCGNIHEGASIGISDSIISINNGVFENVGGKFQKSDKKDADIFMDVSVFAELAFGKNCLEELKFFGKVSGEIDKFSTFFQKSENYVNMLFS